LVVQGVSKWWYNSSRISQTASASGTCGGDARGHRQTLITVKPPSRRLSLCSSHLLECVLRVLDPDPSSVVDTNTLRAPYQPFLDAAWRASGHEGRITKETGRRLMQPPRPSPHCSSLLSSNLPPRVLATSISCRASLLPAPPLHPHPDSISPEWERSAQVRCQKARATPARRASLQRTETAGKGVDIDARPTSKTADPIFFPAAAFLLRAETLLFAADGRCRRVCG
jgi:hypothetical protein